MKLRHLHFPQLTSYTTASRIQENLIRRNLDYKASVSKSAHTGVFQPAPTVLTFQFHPTYTAGLRSNNRLTDEEVAHLRHGGRAEFHYAPRGGQTTFHGPGQLVAYPIVDIKRHGLSARCYVSALEDSVIQTCGTYGVEAQRTENVGVWIGTEKKICAIGVHLRRHISSHGIGLNVTTDTSWFDRIVACGLEGKGSTSLSKEGVQDVTVEDVATVFVGKLATHLKNIDGIESASQDEIDLILKEID